MNDQIIFAPLIAQVVLTAIVWLVMYRTRIAEMKRKRIHPQKLTDAFTAREMLKDVAGPANNFTNLFEVPVLFYVVTISIYVTGLASAAFAILLGLYVFLRAIHSVIHCGYNKVIHRFYIYFLSTSLLWVIWALFAWQLFRNA